MKYARHRDRCERGIIEALRAVGASVWQINAERAGEPDLCVGYKGVNFLFEVKSPPGPRGGRSGRGQHLSEDQVRWMLEWRGQVREINSARDALEAIGLRTTAEEIHDRQRVGSIPADP